MIRSNRSHPHLSLLGLVLVAALGGVSLSGQAYGQYDYAPHYGEPYDDRDRYDDDDSYDDRYREDRYDPYDSYDRNDQSRYTDPHYRDTQLHDRVHAALQRALGPQARHISVRVSRGNVYLSGRVRSAADRQLAHAVAHDVRGVNRVFHGRLYARYW